MCCADCRVEVPVNALGEAVMSTLGVTVVFGADQPERVYELAAVEELVGCDGEGIPKRVIQFHFPLARTVLLYERDAPDRSISSCFTPGSQRSFVTKPRMKQV